VCARPKTATYDTVMFTVVWYTLRFPYICVFFVPCHASHTVLVWRIDSRFPYPNETRLRNDLEQSDRIKLIGRSRSPCCRYRFYENVNRHAYAEHRRVPQRVDLHHANVYGFSHTGVRVLRPDQTGLSDTRGHVSLRRGMLFRVQVQQLRGMPQSVEGYVLRDGFRNDSAINNLLVRRNTTFIGRFARIGHETTVRSPRIRVSLSCGKYSFATF